MMPTADTMPLDTTTTSIPSLDIASYNEQPTNITSSFNELLNITYPTDELLSPAGHYAIGTALAIIALVGIVQNSSTLTSLNKRQKTQRTEVLIKILLVTDVFICVLSLPFAVTSSFARRWLFGSVGCNWYGFSMFFLGIFNINVLTTISIDRYFTVKQIMQIPASGNSRVLVISLVVSALGALVCSTLPLLGVSSYTPEGVGTSCSVDWKSKRPQDQAYFIVILICCFIVPLSIIIACYSHIYIQITSRPLSAGMIKQSKWSQRRIKMEIHLAKTIFLAAGSFVLVWSPYAVISLVAILTDPEAIPPIVFSIPAIFAKCSVFGNSLVYVFMNRDLRPAFFGNLGLMKKRVADEKVLAVPAEQQLHMEPCVIACSLEPREACPAMKDQRPNDGDKGASKGSPQLVH